ncbi:hypothetical protein AAVH_14630 [Aphelenchoides avenae]|nr:hypothetical protein AAVH_14630 [Aphelenchus avenae]
MSSDAENQLEVERMEGPQIAGKTKSGEEDVAANGDADTRKALPPAGDDSEEDEEDLDDKCDELQVVVFSERPRPSMTAMKSTGGGFGRIIRHTAMKSTGGYSARRTWNATSAYTRKAPPPAGDDSEEDEDDLDDEPQLAAVRGRTPMTARKSTGVGVRRTIRRTAMKCTGGYGAYTRKAPPPSVDDTDEDDEEEHVEGEDRSDGEDEAEPGIEDEKGLDEEQDEDDNNARKVKQDKEARTRNDKADEILEGDTEDGLAVKRKRLSD